MPALARCKTLLPSLLLVIAIVAAGCGTSPSASTPSSSEGAAPKASSAGPAGESKGTVGVSVLTVTNPFFRVIGDNITAELAKAGYETVVVSGEDIATQRRQVACRDRAVRAARGRECKGRRQGHDGGGGSSEDARTKTHGGDPQSARAVPARVLVAVVVDSPAALSRSARDVERSGS